MLGGSDDPSRRLLVAQGIVEAAWRDLPRDHRLLLENIGAARWQVVDQELGESVDALLRSAGHAPLDPADRRQLAQAAGLWVEELRLVVINADHAALRDLDEATYEAIVARIAWHEWGHALSVARATPQDIAAGERLLGLAPPGVREPSDRRTTVSANTRTSSSPRSTPSYCLGAGEDNQADQHG